MLITHSKSVTIADNTANTNIVRPSDWNSAHVGALTLSGNTSNQSTWSGSNLIISGGSNVTLGISGNTLFFSASGPVTLDGFDPTGGVAGEFVGGQIGQGSVFLMPANAYAPFRFDRIWLPVIVSLATNSTATASISFAVGLYSNNNATQLTRLSSWSTLTTLNLSGTVSSASFSGLRFMTFDAGAVIPASAGVYVIALWSSTSTSSANATISNLILSNMNTALSGYLGSATNASYQLSKFLGSYSATTGALPASIAASEVRGSAAAAYRGFVLRLDYSTI